MSGEYDFSNVTSLLLFKAISINTSINDVQVTPEFVAVQILSYPIEVQRYETPFVSSSLPDRYVKTQISQKGPGPQRNLEHRQNDSIDVVDNSTHKMLRNGMNNLTTEQTRICGLPGFCSQTAFDTCYNTTLRNCSECSVVASSAFIIFAVCLGLAIFVGNSLILTVGYKRHKKAKESKLDICRNSLAFADILTG